MPWPCLAWLGWSAAVVAGADSGLIDTPRFSRRGDRNVAAVLFEYRLLLKVLRDAMKALDAGRR